MSLLPHRGLASRVLACIDLNVVLPRDKREWITDDPAAARQLLERKLGLCLSSENGVVGGAGGFYFQRWRGDATADEDDGSTREISLEEISEVLQSLEADGWRVPLVEEYTPSTEEYDIYCPPTVVFHFFVR